MTIKSFIKECQEKDVLKLISIYLVSTWVLLQVMAVIWEPIGLPKKSVTILILLLIIAFPFYLYYIYIYKIHTDFDQEQTHQEASINASFKKMYFSAISIFAVVCAFATLFITKANFFNGPDSDSSTPQMVGSPPVIEASDKIAVLKFGNNTANESMDVVGKMAADWIFHGINEKKAGQVISTESILQYSKDFGVGEGKNELEILNAYLKPSKIINGNYFVDGNQLVLQSSIIDGKTTEVLISFKPQYCDQENPLDCIDNVKQLIMSYIFLKDKDEALSLQLSPPKFSSYEALLEAKTKSDDPVVHLNLLNKSISLDSTFFEPQVLRVAHYYGMGNYKKADSLRKLIKPTNYSNKRQANLLKHYEALIKGRNDQIYSTIIEEYNYTPNDLMTNSGAMTVAQQYVNSPSDVGPMFSQISMAGVNLENCSICVIRYYVNSIAMIELGKYQSVIDTLQPIQDKLGSTWLAKSLISAYVRSGQMSEVREILDHREITADVENLAALHLFAGEEALLVGDSAFAKANFSKTQELSRTSENSNVLEATYFLGDYPKALKIAQSLLKESPMDKLLLSIEAITLAKTGQLPAATKVLVQMESLKRDYDYGATDYHLARFYAATGDDNKALDFLLKSIAAGNIYTSRSFQNDPHFNSLTHTPKFKKIMTYWH